MAGKPPSPAIAPKESSPKKETEVDTVMREATTAVPSPAALPVVAAPVAVAAAGAGAGAKRLTCYFFSIVIRLSIYPDVFGCLQLIVNWFTG